MVQVDNLSSTVFLINFSLAWQFCNPATYLHTPFSMNQSIIGTLPFMSINGQQGHTQSHCDDLKSLIYTIIYTARGDLPWTRSSVCSNYEAVLQMKLSIIVEELCKGLPTSFCNFISHVYSLDFDRKPDYQYLHSILSQVSESETTKIDQPNNVLPPACSHTSPPTHSHPLLPACSHPSLPACSYPSLPTCSCPSPPTHSHPLLPTCSPASPSVHPSFNAQHAPVFSDEK